MSFTFDVIINPVILLVGITAGAIVGFGIGRIKIANSRSKIAKLEKEIMNNHVEILEVQRAYAALEHRLNDESIPVISMKINGSKENNPKEKASK